MKKVSIQSNKKGKNKQKHTGSNKITCICRLWRKDHQLLFYDECLQKDLAECKKLEINENLYFNCLSMKHQVKDCMSEFEHRHGAKTK